MKYVSAPTHRCILADPDRASPSELRSSGSASESGGSCRAAAAMAATLFALGEISHRHREQVR